MDVEGGAETAARARGGRTDELRRAKEVHEVLVVVQAPHALAPRRLEPEDPLHLAHGLDVLGKDAQDERALVALGEDARADEAHEVGDEGQLVARAVVETLRRAEGRHEVEVELGRDGGFERVGEVVRGEGEEGALQLWLGLRAGASSSAPLSDTESVRERGRTCSTPWSQSRKALLPKRCGLVWSGTWAMRSLSRRRNRTRIEVACEVHVSELCR